MSIIMFCRSDQGSSGMLNFVQQEEEEALRDALSSLLHKPHDTANDKDNKQRQSVVS